MWQVYWNFGDENRRNKLVAYCANEFGRLSLSSSLLKPGRSKVDFVLRNLLLKHASFYLRNLKLKPIKMTDRLISFFKMFKRLINAFLDFSKHSFNRLITINHLKQYNVIAD